MRDARREAGRALLLFAIVLPLLVPLLQPGWIQSHEGISYPIRLVEVRRAWDDGLLSARWFPDLLYGQGYPFLSFYAPLLFWSAGVLHVLGGDVTQAVKLHLGAVTLCSYTTVIGYGSLVLADNQALQSFGRLAMIGELACLYAALLFLPSLLHLMKRGLAKQRDTDPQAVKEDVP